MANEQSRAFKLATFSIGPIWFIVMAMALIIPAVMLFIGITKFNDCEANSNIPLWMIIVAVLMLLERAAGSVNSLKENKFLEANPKPTDVEEGVEALADWEKRRKASVSKGALILGTIFRLIQIIAFIIGCFMVFGIYSERDQCNGWVFWISYTYCLASIILYIFASCFLCCTCCCLGLIKASSS